MPPSECPVCGAAVPRKAKSCPACGADERSGWNEDATRYDGLDLPDSAFADEDAPPSRRASKRHAPRAQPHLFWLVVAVVLILLFAIAALT